MGVAFIAKNLQFEGRILSRDKSSDRIGSLVVVGYTLLFLMCFCYQASLLREMSRFANWTYFPEEPCSKPFWLKQFERCVFPTVSEKGRKGRRTEERIKWFWNISQWVVKQVRDKVVRFYLACNLHAKSRTRSRRAIQAQMGGGSLLLSPIFFFLVRKFFCRELGKIYEVLRDLRNCAHSAIFKSLQQNSNFSFDKHFFVPLSAFLISSRDDINN